MPIDPSIPLQVQTPQMQNPLATLSQFGQVAGGIGAMQQLAARPALGQAYQQAIDPNTGQLDTNKLMATAAKDPRLAWMAGDLASQALSQQKTQTEISGQQQDQNLKTHAAIANELMGVVQSGDYSDANILNRGMALLKQGIGDPQHFAGFLSSIPPASNPQAREAWFKQTAIANASAVKDAMGQVYGTPQLVNNGAQQQFVSVSPMNGMHQLSAPFTNQMTPGEAGTPTATGVTPAGQTIMGTRQQFVGQAQGGGSGNSPLAGSFGGGGTTSGIGARQAAVGTAPPGGPPGVVTSLGLADTEGLSGTAKGAVEQYNSLHAQIGGSATRIYQLQKALTGLQGADTGPGSESVNATKSWLLAQSPAFLKKYLPGVDPNKIQSYDEANKYLTAYASGAAGTFGGHTDSQLATALSANASTHISNLAAQDVVKSNVALERMQQAQAQAFDQSGLNASQFNKWAVGWNKEIDPRVFVLDQLDSAKQTKMVNAMQPTERKKFWDQVFSASKAGFVTPPNAK